MALVGGFGGMRCDDGQLSFAPRLPPGIVRLSFRMRFQGRIVHVETQSGKAMYTLLAGDPLPITHHGKEVTLTSETVAMEIPSIEPLPEPMQPVGRVPQSRRNRPLYPERIAPPRPVARRLLHSAALAIGTGARRAVSSPAPPDTRKAAPYRSTLTLGPGSRYGHLGGLIHKRVRLLPTYPQEISWI